jgi:hypothetical protein
MCSFKCCANFEVGLLLQNERLCSLYLVVKSNLFDLYMPIYNRDSLVYPPERANLSRFCVLCIKWFCRVLFVQ